MKKEEILALFKSYEDAVCMIDETECWSARDLQKLFGYSLWQNFTNVIAKMITAGKGAQREVDDILLTCSDCYLVTQNAFPPTSHGDCSPVRFSMWI